LTYQSHISSVSDIAWAPDNGRIASADYEGTIHIWDAFTQSNVVIYDEHAPGVTYLSWSPDGTYIVSSSNDGSVHIWNAIREDKGFTYCNQDGELEFNRDIGMLIQAKLDIRRKREMEKKYEEEMERMVYILDHTDLVYDPFVYETGETSIEANVYNQSDIEDEMYESEQFASYEETDSDDEMSDEYDENYNQYYERDLGEEYEEYYERMSQDGYDNEFEE